MVNRDDLSARAQRVAAIAALHASAVDSEHRFPRKRSKQCRRTAARHYGSLRPRRRRRQTLDVANICYVLGRACASSAMIFAMHQVKVACVVRHGRGSAWMEDFMSELARSQLLLASSTTEGNAAATSGRAPRRLNRSMSTSRSIAARPSFPMAAKRTVSSPPHAATLTPQNRTRCCWCC